MANAVAIDDMESLAKKAAGNWLKFESFAWHDKPGDASQWTIYYTRNRDSDVLAVSNAEAIKTMMEPFTEGDDPDTVSEHHNHFACGWVEGYAIRVYRDGKVTAAFQKLAEILKRLENYPVLDEEDFSAREYEDCLAAIKECGHGKVLESLDEDWWPGRVYRELNISSSNEVREKNVLAKLSELELLQPDEIPHVVFPAHVKNALKLHLASKTEEEVRETLFEVLMVMLAENGRAIFQAEEVERVLTERGLWPTH